MAKISPKERVTLIELNQEKDYAGIAAGSTGHGPLRSITNSNVLIRADARAKLMFYIHVVLGVLGLTEDDDLKRFADYQRFKDITSFDDMTRLVDIAESLHPRKLLGKRLFEDKEISDGMRFNVRPMEDTGVVMNRRTLEGLPYTVTDLFTMMSCNHLWLYNYFYLPFEFCEQVASKLTAHEIEKQRQQEEFEHCRKLEELENLRKQRELEQEHRLKQLEIDHSAQEFEQQLKIEDLERECNERLLELEEIRRLEEEKNLRIEEEQKKGCGKSGVCIII